MSHSDRIHDVIFGAIRDVRDMLPPDVTIREAPDEPLMATAGGALDSLGVVNLMVAVESRCQSAFPVPISLADALGERPEASPFRSVATLSAYLASLIEAGTRG